MEKMVVGKKQKVIPFSFVNDDISHDCLRLISRHVCPNLIDALYESIKSNYELSQMKDMDGENGGTISTDVVSVIPVSAVEAARLIELEPILGYEPWFFYTDVAKIPSSVLGFIADRPELINQVDQSTNYKIGD